MSQISYNIFSELKQKNAHVRALSLLLNTNPMTISRKLQELQINNILDHVVEGKNKVYFIKDSLEAREFEQIVEHYKLLNLIKPNSKIRFIVEEIKSMNNISLAVIFGSYAKGNQTTKSDIDIYIETTDKKIKSEVELINSEISVKIGTFDKQSLLIKEIIKHHVIIKGVEKFQNYLLNE